MTEPQPSTTSGGLRRGALGPLQIVFFVIATNGPLIGLVGAVPIAIAFGNGVGLAGAFVVVGLIYLLFSIGFAAMSRHVNNTGAFYSYITAGLGRPPGITAAFLAIVAYVCIQLTCFAMMGFFLGQAESTHLGWTVPWWVNALVVALLVWGCGYRNVEFSGRLLGVLMLCEIAIILVFDVAVVAHGGGPEGFSSAPFLPSNVFVPGIGAALVFIAGSYFGFETTAIYAEEARDPKKTVAIATYVALLIITAFFAFSVWAVIVAHGPSQAVAAAKADPGNFWFGITSAFVSPTASLAMSALMITSLFAALVSLQNSITRYFFALGRERVLWARLAETHPVQQTPHIAGAVQTAFSIVCILAFGLSGADPMETVLPIGSTVSSVAILIVQVLTSFAVIGFFRRRGHGANVIESLIAPVAAAVALSTLIYFIFASIPMLVGQNKVYEVLIPCLIVAVVVFGMLYAMWLRVRRAERYENLGRLLTQM